MCGVAITRTALLQIRILAPMLSTDFQERMNIKQRVTIVHSLHCYGNKFQAFLSSFKQGHNKVIKV